jgi:hypothetical protein
MLQRVSKSSAYSSQPRISIINRKVHCTSVQFFDDAATMPPPTTAALLSLYTSFLEYSCWQLEHEEPQQQQEEDEDQQQRWKTRGE